MNQKHSGQVMLLTVLLIGGGILSMTAISGYLTVQRIRMASNAVDSTRAILAADAGLECERYNLKPGPDIACDDVNLNFTTPGTGTIIDTTVPGEIKSTGVSNNAYRTFLFSY